MLAFKKDSLNGPVSLLHMAHKQTGDSIQYYATGITSEAEQILSKLSAPLYIVAFTGLGRSGKSFTATNMVQHISNIPDLQFISQPGNVPCTQGIDMVVFKHPTNSGTIIYLDCEGGGNSNQTALPFVMGLAARLSSQVYVFERACFTTNGLESIMHMVNMGIATHLEEIPDLPKHLILVENMTINESIEESILLDDLMSCEKGDSSVNSVRKAIKDKFSLSFCKIPFYKVQSEPEFKEAITKLSNLSCEKLEPFIIGNVPVDGSAMIYLVQELVSQIRNGGSQFDMISATEAMVANMAREATQRVWNDFVDKLQKLGCHPSSFNPKKPLDVMLKEIETHATESIKELEAFVSRLVPAAPASVAKTTWENNFERLSQDMKLTYQQKQDARTAYLKWADRINNLVEHAVKQIIEGIHQMLRVAKFSTNLIMMGNYYFWKSSLGLVTNFATNLVSPTAQ